MNKNLLASVLAERGDTQYDLAQLLGISLSRTNAKINETGGAQFNQNEITLIKNHYKLNAKMVDAIFFAPKVS